MIVCFLKTKIRIFAEKRRVLKEKGENRRTFFVYLFRVKGRRILRDVFSYRYKKQEIDKTKKLLSISLSPSGYQDSNLGPPAPKAGALTGLRYTPRFFSNALQR